jgi:hypothetical protein
VIPITTDRSAGCQKSDHPFFIQSDRCCAEPSQPSKMRSYCILNPFAVMSPTSDLIFFGSGMCPLGVFFFSGM